MKSLILFAPLIGALIQHGHIGSSAAAPAPTPAASVPARTVVAAPDARLRVQSISGRVVLRAGDAREVRVVAERLGAGARLHVEGGPEAVEVRVECVPGIDDCGADLAISAPRGARPAVQVVSADVEVVGLAGALQVQAVSGDVRVRGDLAEGRLETVSGGIDLAGALAADGRFVLKTVSGRVRVGLPGEARPRVRTVSGEVDSAFATRGGGSGPRLEVTTTSGDVTLARL